MKNLFFIFIILLITNLEAQKKQCIVCAYKDEDKIKMTEPYCNIGTHIGRNRCLCHEQADVLCKKTCEKLGKEHLKTHVWETN